MAVRDNYAPEGLMKYLKRGIVGYRLLTPVHQQRLARHIWLHGVWYKRHKHPEWGDYMSITWQELEKDFGRGGFNAINESLHLFEVTPNWYMDKGQTKGYKLSPLVAEIKERYLRPRKRAPIQLIDSQGRALRALPQPVAAKTKNSNNQEITATAWKDAKPLNKIPVDMEILRALYTHLQHMMQQDTDDMFAHAQQEDYRYITEAVSQLLIMAQTDVAGQGYIMHRYTEARSGRLYAKGVSLQTTPRLIRQAALHGLYEYDFENCHYSIFSQLAAKYGLETEAISYYLTNKKAVREKLAEDIGISLDQVKMCLLAIMYGARDNTWHESAIPNEIGPINAQALYSHPLFQGIDGDIKEGRRVILDSWPTRRTTLVPVLDEKRIRKDEKPEKKLAHLLQGIEALALRAVIKAIPHDVLLLMHDGFVTSKRVNAKELERVVREATGYKMSLSGERISFPADLHF